MNGRSIVILLLPIVALAAGCAGPRGNAPTPYTADAIRIANPPGTTLVFRIEEPDKAPVRRTMHFVSGGPHGCEMEGRLDDAGGAPLTPPSRSAFRWDELRDHALFPAATTRRSRERRSVTAGTFDCWHYVVRDAEDERKVDHFFFALDRPGPPVLLETRIDGGIAFRMELIEDSRGG